MKNTKQGIGFFGTWKALTVLFAMAALCTLMFTACPNAAGGSGSSGGGNTGGGGSSFIPDTAILTVDPNNKTITLTVSASDFNPVEVEGADIDEIPLNTPKQLTAKGSEIILKSGAITALDCKGNQLTGVDVRGLSKLNRLNCSGNQLTSLDLTNQSKLFNLNCSANQLTSLRLANQSDLSELHCYGNELASLDLTNQTKLEELHCYSNKLTSLDLTNQSVLKKLHCYNNELTKIDLRDPALVTDLTNIFTELICYKNKLNEDAVIRILNSLPKRKWSGAFCVLFYDGAEENNYKFDNPSPKVKAAFKTAKDIKKWDIKKEKFPGGSEDLSLPPP